MALGGPNHSSHFEAAAQIGRNAGKELHTDAAGQEHNLHMPCPNITNMPNLSLMGDIACLPLFRSLLACPLEFAKSRVSTGGESLMQIE